MFDPLDLYDGPVVNEKLENDVEPFEEASRYQDMYGNIESSSQNEQEAGDEDDIPITTLDLPSIRYATSSIILTVLRLLRSDYQINFKTEGSSTNDLMTPAEIEDYCLQREISINCQREIVEWYTNKWPNPLLNSLSKIVHKIPFLKSTDSNDKLLNYYTSIIRYCETHKQLPNTNNTNTLELILKEASLRISESCGRTALPSMERDFKFNNLQTVIRLFEPSLTADNLGWKTWGSSMILSQIMVEDDKNFDSIIQKDIRQGKFRVLELGSGTGLVGISWAMKWDEVRSKHDLDNNIEIYLTDLPDIVTNLKQNVTTNGLASWVHADVLDWTDPKGFIDKYGAERFDIILVADPIYSPDHPHWVVNMINKFLKPDGVCHLQIPIRDKYAKERQTLVDLLEANNLSVVAQKYEEGQDDWGLVKYLYRRIERTL